jgi:PAS domain S-box-containing protein
VTSQQVRRYEEGRDGTPASTLVKIAATLKTTVAALVGEDARAESSCVAAPSVASGQTSLQENEARLEMAVAAAALGVWEWRRAAGNLTLSARAREICGFPARGPVTTRMVAAIIHRGDRSNARRQIRIALEALNSDDRALEYRIVTSTGERRQVALNVRAVVETVDGETRAARFIGVLRDITAERAAQARHERSATRLRLALGAARVAAWQSDQASGHVYGLEFNGILGFPGDRVLTADEVRSRYLPGELERIRSITNEPSPEGSVRSRSRPASAVWTARCVGFSCEAS